MNDAFDEAVKVAQKVIAETIDVRSLHTTKQKVQSALDAEYALSVLIAKLRPLFDEEQKQIQLRQKAWLEGQATIERQQDIINELRADVEHRDIGLKGQHEEIGQLRGLLEEMRNFNTKTAEATFGSTCPECNKDARRWDNLPRCIWCWAKAADAVLAEKPEGEKG
jgi:hypothetical protein